MSQYGVHWNGPIERQAGFSPRPASALCFSEFAPDVMRWSLYHGGRREAVLRAPDGYAAKRGSHTVLRVWTRPSALTAGESLR